MRADGISVSGSNVTGAIHKASQLTGANFQYLVATAQVESNFNPNATVSTSSAGGLFQFIEQTWLSTLKQAGPTFGYGNYAKAITQTASGRYVVADPQMRRAIMQLRNDPTANSVMAGVFTNQNAAKVAAQIGRKPSEGELYIAHFLGAHGAAKLISAASTNPGASAAAVFPGAAQANRSIFYDKQGRARSTAQVYGVLVGKYDTAHARFAAQLSGAKSVAAAAPAAPDPAGTASAYAAVVEPSPLADDGQPFHSLFSTGARRQPFDPLVNQLWSPQTAAAPAASGQATQPSPAPSAPVVPDPSATAGAQNSAGVLGLFQTQPTNARALFERGA